MRIPNHSTVVSYAALFIAVATGGAYAVDKVTSRDIASNSIRSSDLKDRRAVAGHDVRRDSLTGKEVEEGALDASQLVAVAGANDNGICDPSASGDVTSCAEVSLMLDRHARFVAVATGGLYGELAAARAACDVRVDGVASSNFSTPGEAANHNTDAGATDGFARTFVTPQPVPPGPHTVALACRELGGDARIDAPTLAVFAISAR